MSFKSAFVKLPQFIYSDPPVRRAARTQAGLTLFSRCWRTLLIGATVLAILAISLAIMAVELTPAVQPAAGRAGERLAKTRSLFIHTVKASPTGGQKIIRLSGNDLAAVTDFALWRKKLEGHTVCEIDAGGLRLQSSIRLPFDAVPLYLNLKLVARDGDNRADIKQLALGKLNLPPLLINAWQSLVSESSAVMRYSRVGAEIIDTVHIQGDKVQFTLNWNKEALARAQNLVTGLADKERILAYRATLAEVVGRPGLHRFVRLGPIMQALFGLARSRSETDNDPVGENRAAILVLNTYINGNRRAGLDPGDAPGDPVRRLVLLNRRADTAQHFAASAALAISGHNTLADMVGLAKEMNDTHSGSGFSFNDLAADQAGAVFGKWAIRSEASARRLQEIISTASDELVYMPSVKDLPEHLNSEEFASRFKDLQSPEFLALKAEIQERVMACTLYRQ